MSRPFERDGYVSVADRPSIGRRVRRKRTFASFGRYGPIAPRAGDGREPKASSSLGFRVVHR
jgi:hypothetical protein